MIQAILKEQKLQPKKEIYLFYDQLKFLYYQSFIICMIYMKGHKYKNCKKTKKHNRQYTK